MLGAPLLPTVVEPFQGPEDDEVGGPCHGFLGRHAQCIFQGLRLQDADGGVDFAEDLFPSLAPVDVGDAPPVTDDVGDDLSCQDFHGGVLGVARVLGGGPHLGHSSSGESWAQNDSEFVGLASEQSVQRVDPGRDVRERFACRGGLDHDVGEVAPHLLQVCACGSESI